MKVFLLTVLAGLVASAVRFAFLEIISRLRESHVDLIEAIGTVYHGSYKHAIFRGTFVQFFFGLGAAFVYLLLLAVFQPPTVYASAAYGGLIGLFHGCVVSFALTVIVDEDHPLPVFRSYGYEVVIYYWVAQILFGIVAGAIIGFSHPKIF